MAAHIYLLTDGTNTKVGITTDFEKRISTYRTHNPNFVVVKDYLCESIEEAKRVETVIKQIFKEDLTGKSKEWFTVNHDLVDRYIDVLLEQKVKQIALPSMHGVNLTDVAQDLKEKILALINVSKQSHEQRTKMVALKEQFSELFANRFELGIPEHKLPVDKILIMDHPCVDTQYCNDPRQSADVRRAIQQNFVRFPHDDHERRYFHLGKLSSGYYVAFCSAKVSMPYLPAIENHKSIDEMRDTAGALGWHISLHHDWSWWYPNETGLVLYQPKTRISTKLRAWDKSFRKWVIERQAILELEKFNNRDSLKKSIFDIANDSTFPLDVSSFGELYERYLNPFIGVYDDEESPSWLRDAYIFLFEKWRKETGLK